jgi:hypothetical protein
MILNIVAETESRMFNQLRFYKQAHVQEESVSIQKTRKPFISEDSTWLLSPKVGAVY